MNKLVKFSTIKNDFFKKNPKLKTKIIEESLALEVIFQLKKEREKQKITQTKLSQLSGVKQDKISKIENGLHNPTILTIYKLANGLGKKVDITFK